MFQVAGEASEEEEAYSPSLCSVLGWSKSFFITFSSLFENLPRLIDYPEYFRISLVSKHTVGTDGREESVGFIRLLQGCGAVPPAGGHPWPPRSEGTFA